MPGPIHANDNQPIPTRGVALRATALRSGLDPHVAQYLRDHAELSDLFDRYIGAAAAAPDSA